MGYKSNSCNKINMYLMRALDALLDECSVTNAAYRCDVTQSAMSVSLRKLRKHYNNELLVKDNNGNLILTPFAKKLQEKVKASMMQFEDTFSLQEKFDPAHEKKVLVIGMPDYVGYVLLPNVLKMFETYAPNIDIIHVAINNIDSIDDFYKYNLDFAIGDFRKAPSSLYTTHLFSDEGVIAADKNHPIMKQKQITAEDIVRYPQVFVSLEKGIGENFIVSKLNDMGLDVQVKLITPHTLLALQVLCETKLITNTVKRLALPFIDKLGLAIRPTPYKLRPYQAGLYWLPQHHQSNIHVWFRNQLKTLL